MLQIDLFEHIENNQVLELLKCFGIKTKTYKQNSYVLKIGSKINYLGVILSGTALVTKTDALGKTVLLETLKTNDIFGHNIVCFGLNKSPVDIIAESECEILFLPFEKVVTPCSKLCTYHLRLIKNVMKMISKRNSLLTDKIDILGQKTTREKILAFLYSYKAEDKPFTVPFSRAGMAEFLCVDRSAMSRELCKMRDEGMLKFYKNNFELFV